MSWPTVPLGSLLRGIVAGKSLKTLERPACGSEFGILKISAVTWGEFRASENKAMPADYDPGDCPRAMSGDILISRANTRELVGAPVLVEESHPQLLLSDKILKLIPDDRGVDRRYLVRVLSSPLTRQHFARSAGGTSGSMTNITQADIRSAPIPLPPLPEQRRIAAILDKADALRAKRREAIAKLDQLLQSVFLDMFGDPVTNPKGWPTREFDESVDLITGYAFKSEEFLPAGQGIKLCRGTNVLPATLDWSDEVNWPREGLARFERFKIAPGDVIVAMDRPWISSGFKIVLVPDGAPECLLVQRVSRIRAKGYFPPSYIYALLASGAFKKHCKPTETTVPHISPNDFRSFALLDPGWDFLNKFDEVYRAVNVLLAQLVQSQDETDALLRSSTRQFFD